MSAHADLVGEVTAMPSATLDDYQLWAHGFALAATLRHSRSALAALLEAPHETLAQLASRLRT